MTSRPATPQDLPSLLIVDDDPAQRQLLESYLAGHGFPVRTAGSGEEALACLETETFGMVVSDVRMPGMSGLDMLHRVRKENRRLPLLLVTAYPDIRDAVGAMRDGAVNYLEKPIDLDELLASVRYTLGLAGEPVAREDSAAISAAVPRDFVCESPAMRDAVREILAVAPSESRVLISGDSGTGKKEVAALIHRLSPRADGPRITLSCAGTPPEQAEIELFGLEPGALDDTTIPDTGRLEQADGGTLVLDEVGALPLPVQAKLLWFLEKGIYRRVGGTDDRRSDVRILATSRVDLEPEARAGRFRDDLLYRLNIFAIHIAPLAERRDDVLPLANLFAERFTAGRPRFSAGAMVCIESYPWPGNVRELRNAMERAALLARGDLILPEHLPPRVRQAEETRAAHESRIPAETSPTMEDIERSVILQKLRENRYNRSETARQLGISRRTLIYRLRRFREQGFSTDPESP